ncbi:hypothetical protein V2J09_008307 [Rumex salicifolius]
MNDDFGSHFPFQSEGFQRNQAQLNYSGSALSSEFSYFTPADTIDAVITPAIYQIPSRKADKETHFGQPIQSENSRVLRKRPLEDLVLRGGFSGLISNSVIPDEVKRLKSKTTEPTMDAESVKAPARRSQKLSDKITSLQKVTDTASVLQEACMYIKIAHQEIRRLAVSYFGSRPFLHPQLMNGSAEKWIPELRSLGLCLVPLSITNQLSADDMAESSAIGQGVTTVMESWRF